MGCLEGFMLFFAAIFGINYFLAVTIGDCSYKEASIASVKVILFMAGAISLAALFFKLKGAY
jgi:hypothetical protein